MAQAIKVVFADVIDSTEAPAPSGSAWPEQSYEVDLSTEYTDKLAKILKHYLDAARATSGRTSRSPKSSRPGGPSPREVGHDHGPKASTSGTRAGSRWFRYRI
jgi:hypothetical protein